MRVPPQSDGLRKKQARKISQGGAIPRPSTKMKGDGVFDIVDTGNARINIKRGSNPGDG